MFFPSIVGSPPILFEEDFSQTAVFLTCQARQAAPQKSQVFHKMNMPENQPFRKLSCRRFFSHFCLLKLDQIGLMKQCPAPKVGHIEEILKCRQQDGRPTSERTRQADCADLLEFDTHSLIYCACVDAGVVTNRLRERTNPCPALKTLKQVRSGLKTLDHTFRRSSAITEGASLLR